MPNRRKVAGLWEEQGGGERGLRHLKPTSLLENQVWRYR